LRQWAELRLKPSPCLVQTQQADGPGWLLAGASKLVGDEL